MAIVTQYLSKHYINERRFIKGLKKLYVLENEHGLVKIGVSKNVDGRANTLSKQGGFLIKNLHRTELCSNHFSLENIVHAKLSSFRRNGEWFEMSYGDAVSVVDEVFEQYARFERKEKDYGLMADKFWDRVSRL